MAANAPSPASAGSGAEPAASPSRAGASTGPEATTLAAAAAFYGVTADDLAPLGAFESDVYAFEGPRGPSILKIVAAEHRSAEQIRAEVDWLLALVDAGVPVAAPLPSLRGAWLEPLAGGAATAVAFRRAPGATVGPAAWTDARVEAWGELLGRLQAHARGWTPPGPRRRPLAAGSYLFRAAETGDGAFTAAAAALARRAEPLLREGPGAGLIHADLHHGNLLLHEERWTAIDFDDCGYGAWAFDVAMPLYYAVRSQRERDPEEVAAAFLPPFLEGFRRHAPPPAGGAEAVATCLDVRQAELVVALRLKLPGSAWTDALRETERDLRTRTIEGRSLLPVATLRRWFPD